LHDGRDGGYCPDAGGRVSYAPGGSAVGGAAARHSRAVGGAGVSGRASCGKAGNSDLHCQGWEPPPPFPLNTHRPLFFLTGCFHCSLLKYPISLAPSHVAARPPIAQIHYTWRWCRQAFDHKMDATNDSTQAVLVSFVGRLPELLATVELSDLGLVARAARDTLTAASTLSPELHEHVASLCHAAMQQSTCENYWRQQQQRQRQGQMMHGKGGGSSSKKNSKRAKAVVKEQV